MFHIWFRFCQKTIVVHKAGEASMLEIEKRESLLEPNWKTCQVMMLFPFYFCLSCKNTGTFETQSHSCCDFPKCFSKYPCSSWCIKKKKKMCMNVWMVSWKLSESTYPFSGKFGLGCFAVCFPRVMIFPCNLKFCSNLFLESGVSIEKSIADLVRIASLSWS